MKTKTKTTTTNSTASLSASLLCWIALVAAPAWAAESAPSPPLGQVRGQVLDGLSGGGMMGILVQARGTQAEAQTDAEGAFALQLPPGAHELLIACEFYRAQVVAVQVRAGQLVTLKGPIVLALAEDQGQGQGQATVYVIREPDRNSTEAQNLVRRDSARVSDIVSAEEIRKSTDGSAAQAASRVVGATIVGDRFVFVRGLGERYTNALFNGAPLPSPEPDQQAVPFDIFPASLLANLTVAKSATPDIPGDFAGGSVQINTLSFPSKLTLHLSASLGANLQTFLQPALTYRGGSLDWLGIDDGTRAPKAPQPGQTAADFGRSFPNLWSPRRLALGPPAYGFSASLGNQAAPGGRKLGYLLSLSYGADAQTREEEVRVQNLVGSELVPQVRFGGEAGAFRRGDGPYSVRSTYSVRFGGLGTVSLQAARGHRLSLSGVFTQNANREARVFQGFSQEQFAELWNSRLRFVSRTFGLVQLTGDHHAERLRLGDSDVDWSLSYAAAARAEPDNREVTYLRKDDGRLHFTPKGSSGQRFYSDNLEHQLAGLLSYTQSFPGPLGLASRFKLGAAVRYRAREFSATRYKFGFGGLGEIDDTLPPEAIFAPENIGTSLEVRENTNTADRYQGSLGVYAAYGLVDLTLVPRLRLMVGLRFEAALQRLRSRDPRSADQQIEVALDTFDPLPSLNLIYRLRDDMNLRAAASMTVARPEFRELSPFQFADFFGGELVQGNPDLKRTRIVNADLRWEWFLGAADLVAASAFYKFFDQPIEATINAGGDLIRSFANASSAHNLGAELEGRKELLFGKKGLRGLSLGGNLALIYSRVDLRGVLGQQSSLERPLQGQSPFVVNLFAELDRPDLGTQVRLLYNVFGERIDQVGAFGLPDRYQAPQHQLDLSATQRLPRGLSLRLAARNLLNSPVHVVQGGQTTLRYSTGQTLMLTLSYRR